MSDPPRLDYFAPRRPPRALAPVLLVMLVLLPVVFYGLFELQRMPYRPPQDMSTFLDGPSILLVRVLMALVAVGWLGCGVAYRSLRRARH